MSDGSNEELKRKLAEQIYDSQKYLNVFIYVLFPFLREHDHPKRILWCRADIHILFKMPTLFVRRMDRSGTLGRIPELPDHMPPYTTTYRFSTSNGHFPFLCYYCYHCSYL